MQVSQIARTPLIKNVTLDSVNAFDDCFNGFYGQFAMRFIYRIFRPNKLIAYSLLSVSFGFFIFRCIPILWISSVELNQDIIRSSNNNISIGLLADFGKSTKLNSYEHLSVIHENKCTNSTCQIRKKSSPYFDTYPIGDT